MTATKSTSKPQKPYPEFPLFSGNNGQWCKKFKGKKHYFGPWDDWKTALAAWIEFRDRVEAGLEPSKAATGGLIVADLVELYLDAQDAKVSGGALTMRTFQQYQKSGKWLVSQLGEFRTVESLRAVDFTSLRRKFPKQWGTYAIKQRITDIRSVMKWAYDNELIDKPIRCGDAFKKPPRKQVRKERATKPKKLFSQDEIHNLIEHASVQMKAMIYLGLNAGYGNSDCARLKISDVNGEWLDVIRGKTGTNRKAWLWPETRDALIEALKVRHAKPKSGCEELLFLTHHGNRWVSETSNYDAVAIQFRKLKINVGCHRAGVGFYALRHCTETVGGDTADQVATDFVLGHVDESMAASYREDVFDPRIKKVCNHVRNWFLTGKAKKTGGAK